MLFIVIKTTETVQISSLFIIDKLSYSNMLFPGWY